MNALRVSSRRIGVGDDPGSLQVPGDHQLAEGAEVAVVVRQVGGGAGGLGRADRHALDVHEVVVDGLVALPQAVVVAVRRVPGHAQAVGDERPAGRAHRAARVQQARDVGESEP